MNAVPAEAGLPHTHSDRGGRCTCGATDAAHDHGAWDEQRFRELLESAPDAMVIVDGFGVIQLVNAQTEQVFGYDRAELLGQPVELLVPDRFRDRHIAHRSDFAEGPQARPMGAGLDLYGLRKDGTEFPVEISLSPLQADGGRLYSAAVRDVSDRKAAEQRFRELLESAPDAMVIVDGTGAIQLVNAQTEQLFGYDRAELLGRPVEASGPPPLPRAAHGAPLGLRRGAAAAADGRRPGSVRASQGRDRVPGGDLPVAAASRRRPPVLRRRPRRLRPQSRREEGPRAGRHRLVLAGRDHHQDAGRPDHLLERRRRAPLRLLRCRGDRPARVPARPARARAGDRRPAAATGHVASGSITSRPCG